MRKVDTNVGGIKYVYQCLSASTGAYSLAEARGISPRTGGQTTI